MIKFFRKIRHRLLAENRFSKYLIYAFGEIILVVIGILIALQIKNWNEAAIKEKRKKAYTQSLIKNLESDSITLNSFLTLTKKSNTIIENQLSRIYGPKITADSLIKIARHEFTQSTSAFANTFHNETFKTLVASGDIEMFSSEITNDLMELNSLHEQAVLDIARHNQNYVNQLTKYGEKYLMIPNVPKIESPIQKMMWDNINKKEFSSLFTSVVVLKAVLVNNGRKNHTEIEKRTSNLLDKLRKH